MSKFIPYPFYHDDVPMDISFVFEGEKPAGKHGFLKVSGREFVFEDGTPVKFWGTNFNGAGCFPEYDYAKQLARRLAKLGINLVRLHQLDAPWHTPNIFAFTRGKRLTNAHLDPRSMDRLDHLLKCLKDEGIYIYMDMFTYRIFVSDEGVDNAHLLGVQGCPYCSFSRKLIALQKELATELWTHENPYTGLRYCDDPAIVLAEVVNESDLFRQRKKPYIEPYRTEFMDMFAAWAKENGIETDLSQIDPALSTDDCLLDFKVELQSAYYREMTEHLRSIGVRIPISGTNWVSPPDNFRAQRTCDFLDTHHYFYDWGWREFERRCMNRSITEEKSFYLRQGCLQADAGLPTYVSEWDVPWPNAYRADSVIYSAAYGMFQGWSGFAIHTYSYSARLDRMNVLGEEFTSRKLGGTPYRQGIFSTWNDPAKFGLFYHAALLTRRNDVKAGGEKRAIRVEDRRQWPEEQFAMGTEHHACVTDMDGTTDLPTLQYEDNGEYVVSDTGELYRNFAKHYGKVDTPRTKCAFGFLQKNGAVELSGMTVRCKTDFAVIAVSSLTDDAIEQADNLLLTAVGRAENTDARFRGDWLVELGKPPVQIECIETEIELKTDHPDLQVWAVSAEGFYIGTVPTRWEDGVMHITLGQTSQSMYYHIIKP